MSASGSGIESPDESVPFLLNRKTRQVDEDKPSKLVLVERFDADWVPHARYVGLAETIRSLCTESLIL